MSSKTKDLALMIGVVVAGLIVYDKWVKGKV